MALKKKAVLYGSVVGNTYLRSENIVWKMAVAARNAAGAFGALGYPVFYANCKEAWRPQDQETTDPSNMTPSGHQHVAAAFCGAALAPANRPSWMIDVTRLVTIGRISNVYVPATASSAGMPGQFTWDTGFWYLCVGTNVWKRAALSSW